ncbi:CopG family ribbon-helix-helix protein [Aurantivibrio plasticivorans]
MWPEIMESVKEKISRISVSLPEALLRDLDKMVADRSCDSRSQLIVDMIHQQLSQHQQDEGNNVMAGTINIVFDHSVPNLQKQLAEIHYKYIDEVISSLNVNLTESRTMSVVLVQGPGGKLKDIANQMTSLRGVITGRLLLSTAIIPQVHPLPPIGEPGERKTGTS